MPELKRQDILQFPQMDGFDVNKIPYKNKQQENARLEKLEEFKKTGVWPGNKQKFKSQSQPWSRTRKMKEEKKERKLKKKRKRQVTNDNEGKSLKKRKIKKGASYKQQNILLRLFNFLSFRYQ